MTRRILLTTLMVLASAVPAAAHVGIGTTAGFVAGAAHPLSGLDHVLAMTAVGLWASMLGGRALWAVPSAFVAAMVAGGFLGLAGVSFPLAEFMIGLSVLVLGALVAMNVRLPVAVGMMVVAAFAVAHGHAHGAEMPAAAGAVSYAAGFVTATAALHAFGLGLGIAAQRLVAPAVARLAGLIVAALGLSLVVAG